MLTVLIYEKDDLDIAELAATMSAHGARTIELLLCCAADDYRIDSSLDGFELAYRDTVLTDRDLRSADLIIYRRYSSRNPSPVTVPALEGDSRRFAEREWAAALQGAVVAAELNHTGPRWCNRPSLDGVLRNKIALLASARAASLSVPDLRIGNYTPTPEGDRFVVKAINADEFISDDRKFMTTDFPAELVARFRGERVPAPTLVQAKVDFEYEVRCYVVGSSVLGYRIGTPDGVTDSRLVPAADLLVDRVELDEATSGRLLEWTRRRGLLFCAFDLLVDRDGLHLLIDINPHGTWNWYSVALPELAHDISNAFLELLAGN
jgi:hypothetical protein